MVHQKHKPSINGIGVKKGNPILVSTHHFECLGQRLRQTGFAATVRRTFVSVMLDLTAVCTVGRASQHFVHAATAEGRHSGVVVNVSVSPLASRDARMESMQAARAFCWTLHSTSHADGSSSEEETSTGVEEGGKEDMIVHQMD